MFAALAGPGAASKAEHGAVERKHLDLIIWILMKARTRTGVEHMWHVGAADTSSQWHESVRKPHNICDLFKNDVTTNICH